MDKDFRLDAGLPWFETEKPNEEIRVHVNAQLEKHHWQVDYVFSHTGPLFVAPIGFAAGYIEQTRADLSVEEWLGSMERNMKYEKWYFGHFHVNEKRESIEILYEEIKELGADDFLQRLGRPMYRCGERVIFTDDKGEYHAGQIRAVDAYGTMEQTKEVSYDIGEKSILYKHVPESQVESGY